jgi:hypothetical protein
VEFALEFGQLRLLSWRIVDRFLVKSWWVPALCEIAMYDLDF